MLQRLSDETWGPYDGLGALVITPTRELALQIFNELRKVGKYHSFSAGLLIGGKSVDEEKDRVGKMNILVCYNAEGMNFSTHKSFIIHV